MNDIIGHLVPYKMIHVSIGGNDNDVLKSSECDDVIMKVVVVVVVMKF